MKALLLIFGTLSRFVFEFGVIALAWMLWGWHVGLAFILWYILWTMTGFTLVEAIIHDENRREWMDKDARKDSDEKLKESFKKLSRILEEAKAEYEKEKKEGK